MADEPVVLPEISVTAPKAPAPATPTPTPGSIPSMVGAPAPITPAPDAQPAPAQPTPDQPAPAPTDPQKEAVQGPATAGGMDAPAASPTAPAPVTPPQAQPAVPGATPKHAVDVIPLPDVQFKTPLAPMPVSNNPWEPELERASLSAGVSADTMRRMASHESGNRVNAQNPRSSAGGIFQFTDDTWASMRARYPQLGLNNKMDPFQQARAAPYYMREINENLHRVLGREPTPTESYIGWFLGPEGAAVALSHDQSTPIEHAVRSAAIAANPNVFSKVHTVGDLYHWAGQFMGDQNASQQPSIDLSPYLTLGEHSNTAEAISGMRYELKSPLAKMLGDLPPELKGQVTINSGYRSPENQAKLWADALKKYGSEEAARKWVAPPGHSHHNMGLAADLGFKSDAAKKWVHDNAAKYGLGFPLSNEDWHIEPLNAREASAQRQGLQRPVDYVAAPPQHFNDIQAALDQKHAQEASAFSMIQAAKVTANQDWIINNALRTNGKDTYDPNFKITPEMLQHDTIKSLPDNYLNYIGKANSQQDFDWRVHEAQKSFVKEQRLAATPYGGLVRFAVNAADPAGVALGAIAPFGFAAKGAQLGRAAELAAIAADGALGGAVGSVPEIMNRPGAEKEQALWAAATGAVGYLTLNPHTWHGTSIEKPIQRFIDTSTNLRKDLESGTALTGAGAAAVPGYRAPLLEDSDAINALSTPKTATPLGPLRFDMAKQKNSENKLVAALTDQLVQDTVGNADKNVPITRPIEADARMMMRKAEVGWGRRLDAASEKYREDQGFTGPAGNLKWATGGQADFYSQIVDAVRSKDPLAEFHPAVKEAATAFTDTMDYWLQRWQNPGLDRGEVRPPLSGSENWDKNHYVPRYHDWAQFTAHHVEFGDQQLARLWGEAIHGGNPDLDRDLAMEGGRFFLDRLARTRAGQEDRVQFALSGMDPDALKAELHDYGFDADQVEKLLWIQERGKDKAEPTLTSRQKRRTLMDENFSMVLHGKNGPREVAVKDFWVNDANAIMNAYNRQASGAIALANLRIPNPLWKEGMEAEKRYIVDGIYKPGDWEKIVKMVKAHDYDVRPHDMGRTVDKELKNLQWAVDSIRGIPSEQDRSKLGQFLRTLHHYNLIRLGAQMGFASLPEFMTILSEVGLKAFGKALPGSWKMIGDVWKGGLKDEELLHLERTFTPGTDYVRGNGLTWTSHDRASNLNDGSRMSKFLDRAEIISKKAANSINNITLAPITAMQQKVAIKGALARFVDAAGGGKELNQQRMRLLGLSKDMENKILAEIQKHKDAHIIGENGRKINILNLDAWEPQTRSAFEFAIDTWARRMVQENDFGMMNALLGTPLAKIMYQFRGFAIGSFSKHLLAGIHARDLNVTLGFLLSSFLGALGYAVQQKVNTLGMSDTEREKTLEKNLSWHKIAAAGFQRAGASSILPDIADVTFGAIGLDPIFNARSTQNPSEGWTANPTTGLFDAMYSATRQLGKGVEGTDPYSSKDARNFVRAFTPFGMIPILTQLTNYGASHWDDPTQSH